MRAKHRHLVGEKRASSAIAAELFFSRFSRCLPGGQDKVTINGRRDLKISVDPYRSSPRRQCLAIKEARHLSCPIWPSPNPGPGFLPCLRTSPEKGVRMVAQTPPRQNVVREYERDPPRREHVEREGHPVSCIRRPAIGRRRGSPGCRNQEAR